MIKYFLALFTCSLFFTGSVFANDGIVIVLEAPLLNEPSLSSKVLQTIRKGQRVYIPREIANQNELPEFIPTFDRAGNPAYIYSKYVKFITGTPSENRQPITLAGHDPTDYRIEEPIPATYPFENRTFLRASISVLLGTNTKSPYGYNSSLDKQTYTNETGARLAITRKINYDRFDRFYFGLIAIVTTAQNEIEFKNQNTAEEGRDALRVGPWITYDAYKNDKYRLTLGSGFTFNYHRATLQVEAPFNNDFYREQRMFSGLSISPMTSTTFQINDIMPSTDFIVGADLSLFLPYTLKTPDAPEFPELWGEDQEIHSALKASASVFMGIQIKY